ncbi:MAG: 50S ribosomal protein L24 [Bacteroidota bacterium]
MSKKNKNKSQQKRFAPKLKIKKGDRVRVLAGDHKGSEGEVLEVFPVKNRAIVEDVNIVKKHKKPTQDTQGGIFEEPASVHISNLMLLDPSTGEPTRVGRRMEDSKLKRFSKKSDKVID